MKIKAWSEQLGWREPAQGASPNLEQWWYSGLSAAVHKGTEAAISPAVTAPWVGRCQPSWGQQGCNPELSLQASAQTENFSFVAALSCPWSAARTWAPEITHSRGDWGACSAREGQEGRGWVRAGLCGRRAAEIWACRVSHFALHEGPQHSPRVPLSEKVNRIKKMLPNAF